MLSPPRGRREEEEKPSQRRAAAARRCLPAERKLRQIEKGKEALRGNGSPT